MKTSCYTRTSQPNLAATAVGRYLDTDESLLFYYDFPTKTWQLQQWGSTGRWWPGIPIAVAVRFWLGWGGKGKAKRPSSVARYPHCCSCQVLVGGGVVKQRHHYLWSGTSMGRYRTGTWPQMMVSLLYHPTPNQPDSYSNGEVQDRYLTTDNGVFALPPHPQPKPDSYSNGDTWPQMMASLLYLYHPTPTKTWQLQQWGYLATDDGLFALPLPPHPNQNLTATAMGIPGHRWWSLCFITQPQPKPDSYSNGEVQDRYLTTDNGVFALPPHPQPKPDSYSNGGYLATDDGLFALPPHPNQNLTDTAIERGGWEPGHMWWPTPTLNLTAEGRRHWQQASEGYLDSTSWSSPQVYGMAELGKPIHHTSSDSPD